ncbi:hypothetical protein [Hyphobacterium sp.]|uniref:hypothetical protein n=1 Tax=Hyphobacterium sp. TaxID=2004662 RepID=UPI003B5244DC
MWADDPDTCAALAALGLDAGASLEQAKSAFRKRAVALHPDTGEASGEALAELARIIRAVRHLEQVAPKSIDIELDPGEISTAATRTIRVGGRMAVFRIPENARTGDTIAAVGDPALRARIRVNPAPGEPESVSPASGLQAFVSEFAAAAPAARFARWLRKARSAA